MQPDLGAEDDVLATGDASEGSLSCYGSQGI